MPPPWVAVEIQAELQSAAQTTHAAPVSRSLPPWQVLGGAIPLVHWPPSVTTLPPTPVEVEVPAKPPWPKLPENPPTPMMSPPAPKEPPTPNEPPNPPSKSRGTHSRRDS